MGVNLADTLPRLLRARGLTQEELADATGITRTDINALARGRIEAGPTRLRRIAEALDVSALDLGAPEATASEEAATLRESLEELAEMVARGFEALGVSQDQLRPGADAPSHRADSDRY